jgi:hypothetical protein
MGNYFAAALYAFSHFRHSSAHAFKFLSSGNASQALAQLAQHIEQHSHITAARGPSLAQTWEQAAQQVAQSRQCIRHDK